MTRLQRILGILLILQVGLAAIVFWPHTQANAEAVALFPDLETANIVKITLEDNQNQQAELTARERLAAWPTGVTFLPMAVKSSRSS